MTEGLGDRLRAARVARGLSLRAFAQDLGVSASLISQVENGKTQPSVSTLYAMVSLLGVSIDDLLGVVPTDPRATEEPTALAHQPVQHGDDNPVLEMENGVRWERLAVGDGDAVDPLLVTYAPGAASSIESGLMQHAGFEYAYLLEGELTLHLDGAEHVLRAGDSLHFDSMRPHQYVNASSAPARGLWFVVGRRPGASSAAPSPLAGRTLSSAVDVLHAMRGEPAP